MSSAPESRGLLQVASRNASVAVLARISAIVVGLVLTPFVLRRLTAELYGVVITVGAAYEYLLLLRGGIGGALRRFVTLHHQANRPETARAFYAAGFWWGAVLRTAVLLIALALALPLTRFLRLDPALVHDAALGIAAIFLAAVIGDQTTMFSIPIYATGRTVPTSVLQILQSWARVGLIMLALTWFTPGLRVYGGAVVLAEILTVIAMGIVATRTGAVGSVVPAPRFGPPEVRREIFRYGGFAVLSQTAALLYLSTDNLLIGRIYGPAIVTHYSLGTRWAPLIRGFLVAIMAGITPIFTGMEARGEAARSRDAMLRVVGVTSAFSVACCLVPCVLGDLFLLRWVGPEYSDSYAYLLAMLGPMAIEGALSPVWMGLIARGRIGWVATGDVVVAVGNVAVSLLLALTLGLGPLGFALGNTVATLAKNLLLRPLAGRRDETMPPMKACLRPFPLALIGAAPALGLLWVLRPVYGGSLAGVVGAGLAGGGLALGGALYLAVGRAGLRQMWRLTPFGRRVSPPAPRA